MISCRKINIEDNKGWLELMKNSKTATFFQTKEWISLWIQHFVPEKQKEEVIILGVYDSEELISIAPLYLKDNKVQFLAVTEVLGNELVSDFGDIIAVSGKEREVWEAVLTWYRGKGEGERGKGSELNFIREDSVSFGILKDMGGIIEEVDTAPYIELPKSWDEYLLSLNRHNRHELRRKIRRLEEEGAFKVCTEGEPTDIKEFFRLMVLSNEQKRNFLSNKMREFFQDIFNTFWTKKMLNLCFLKLKGENIAAVLLFEYKNELLLYNSGFDPKYAKFSPGLLLKAYVVKQAIEEGKGRFDFLRGGERYKYDLGAVNRRLYNVTFD